MPDRPTIIADTREQRPWRFTDRVQVQRATVPTGADYTVAGFEDAVGVERKSLDDLVSSLTHDRPRFLRSLEALARRPWRCVIVEAPLSALLFAAYRSRAKPSSILGAVCAIIADGVPIYFADDAGAAATLAERLLLKFADRAASARRAAA